MQNFTLYSQLEQDSILIADWQLCQVRIINEQKYPWFLLIPRVNNAREMLDLSDLELSLFWQESKKLSQILQNILNPNKLNIAALGNMVPQLHWHHIARFENDPAWPKPIWGVHPLLSYPKNIDNNFEFPELINQVIFAIKT